MYRILTISVTLSIALLLGGCGGGGGGAPAAVGSSGGGGTTGTSGGGSAGGGTSSDGGGGTTSGGGTGTTSGGDSGGGGVVTVADLANPVMFVTQVPAQGDFASRASTFGNHLSGVEEVPRGGDLMIRYPDGTLRNLTREAGFGTDDFQGATAIAVREPTVHWSGTKAIFSMIVGSPTEQTASARFFWQMYEVTGLGPQETAKVTKVPNQPAGFNNVSPFYATDDRVLFTSDRPRSGLSEHFPNLDEYESAQSVSGIWSLNPATGDLHLLNHTPSGAFSPSVDSFGRVVFIRWDHLQRDQQRDAGDKGAFNFTDESAAAVNSGSDEEVFPEPRIDVTSTPYGPLNGHRFNAFTPWQMNQDGTEEETINHVGRQELNFGFLGKTFQNDPVLSEQSDDSQHANKTQINTDGGLFHLREDPARPGKYIAIRAKEFGSLTTGPIVRIDAPRGLDADQITVLPLTEIPATGTSSPKGRYRNPLPLTSGALVASYSAATDADPSLITDLRLKLLNPDPTTGLYEGGAAAPLTPGIQKSVTWFNPNNFSAHPAFSGTLWELEAVEVVARARPANVSSTLEDPEARVFAQQGVDPVAFRSWLAANNLAVIVSRNVTSRDDADRQQPFNLSVPGGVSSLSPSRPSTVYALSHMQILQADQIRGYSNFRPGRRSIAQPLHDTQGANPANPGGPAGSVKIASDGSVAAFVPARRALSWQTTDAAGTPIVRERLWLTVQPGEVRVCASCHGANEKDQVGRLSIANEPEALRQLLMAWKSRPQ